MIIENKKGVQFEITSDEWNTSIVAKGNEHKYRVIEDDSPVEVKQLRLIKETKKKKA